MTFKKMTAVFLTLLLLCSLAGCAAKMNQATKEDFYYTDAEMPQSGIYEESVTSSVNMDSGALTDRKLIKTVNISAETEDLDTLMGDLTEAIAAAGGYVENQTIHNGSSYSKYRSRSATLTVRVPAEKLEEFVDKVAGSANVVSQEASMDDVTLTYVATESRIEALQTEQKRLLELMEQAETMSDLLEVEARLTEVRYELESVTTQMNILANQVNYSTVELYIDEVKEYTPVEEETFWQRISGGFMDSLKGIVDGTVDFTVFVLSNLPYLVLIAVGITVLFLIIRRRYRKKKAQKNQQNAE